MINNYYIKEYLDLEELYLKNKKIVFIPELYSKRFSPCFYIRIMNKYFSGDFIKNISYNIFSIDSINLKNVSTVVAHRIPSETVNEILDFINILKLNNINLVYDIDDNLIEIDSNHPEYKNYINKIEIVRHLTINANLVTVSTKKLRDECLKLNKNVIVLENYIDIKYKIESFENKHKYKNKIIEILYMGTYTHNEDLMLVIKALDKLFYQGFKFKLNVIGVSLNIPRYNWINVVEVPKGKDLYPHFMNWLKSKDEYTIGIAPLCINKFNDCKSAIKYWDYTSLGMVTVASNISGYSEIIENGINGLLVENNEDSWYEVIKGCMSGKYDLPSIYKNANEFLKLKKDLISNSENVYTIFEKLNWGNNSE